MGNAAGFHARLAGFVEPMGFCPKGIADQVIKFSPKLQPLPRLLSLDGSKIDSRSVPGMSSLDDRRLIQGALKQQWRMLHHNYEGGRVSEAIEAHERVMPFSSDGDRLRAALKDRFGNYTLRELMGAEFDESDRAELLELAGMLNQGVWAMLAQYDDSMRAFRSLLTSAMICAKLGGEQGNSMAEAAFALAGYSLKGTLNSYLVPIMHEAAAEVWDRGKRSKVEVNVHRQLAAHGWKAQYKGDPDFDSILLRFYRAMWNALQGGLYTLYSGQNKEYAEYVEDAGMLEDAGYALARGGWAQSLSIVVGAGVNSRDDISQALSRAADLFNMAEQYEKEEQARDLAKEAGSL